MIMWQNVTAGKTPVGTECQAKLAVGTLGDGTVFPKNAIFSGKVIEWWRGLDRTVPAGDSHGFRAVEGWIRRGRITADKMDFASPTTAPKTRLHNSGPGGFVDRRIYPVLQATDRP